MPPSDTVQVPTGHGERLTLPASDACADAARTNAVQASRWSFEVAGLGVQALRRLAREELLATAVDFSASIGVVAAAPRAEGGSPLVFMTGHQPELVHPGVWMKNFLVAELAQETGGVGVNLVVDTDGLDRLVARTPRMAPGLSVFSNALVVAAPGAAYVTTPAPSSAGLRRFRADGLAALGSLSSPALARHFAEFCDALDASLSSSPNVATLVTQARRRFEARVAAQYLEVPVSEVSRGAAFARFFVDIAFSAQRFAWAFNGAISAYRVAHKTRSLAQPFPMLRGDTDTVELPFWVFDDSGRRHPLFAQASAAGVVVLLCGDGPEGEAGGLSPLLTLPPNADAATQMLREGPLLAPRAVTLTLFHRLFACDLFVHGVGGARYDEVTDELARAYYGIEPPTFAVASLTLYLPLGAPLVHGRDVEAAERKLERFTHNPDDILDDEELPLSGPALAEATRLASEKRSLREAIQGADAAQKKALGVRIRAVNAALAEVMQPVAAALAIQVDRLRTDRAASDLVTDRSYPFCFWHPREISDKAR